MSEQNSIEMFLDLKQTLTEEFERVEEQIEALVARHEILSKALFDGANPALSHTVEFEPDEDELTAKANQGPTEQAHDLEAQEYMLLNALMHEPGLQRQDLRVLFQGRMTERELRNVIARSSKKGQIYRFGAKSESRWYVTDRK